MLMAIDVVGEVETVSVTINGVKTISIPKGGTLLDGLRGSGVFIPSACGGRSMCGTCRLKVLSGGGEAIPRESKHLTQEDFNAGMRLSCCVAAEQDLRIELPEALLSVKEYETTVELVRDLTYDVKEFRLKVRRPSPVPFLPGQYMQFRIPPYDGSLVRAYRAYSISNSPSDCGYLEFAIRRAPSGIATTFLFDHLKIGDILMLNGSYGNTILQDTKKEIVFIAGSTGVAPIKSILHFMAEKGTDRKATFYFGAVKEKDIFYVEEMKEFEKTLPKFSFVPALSDKGEGSSWKGEEGLITEVVDRHCRDLSDAEAYLCGSPGMIKACLNVLSTKAISAESIFYDGSA